MFLKNNVYFPDQPVRQNYITRRGGLVYLPGFPGAHDGRGDLAFS
jgi:hypothetical protein